MATITFTTTTAQDARLVVAFGRELALGRNATGPEVKAWLAGKLREVVQRQEHITDVAALVPSPFDPT